MMTIFVTGGAGYIGAHTVKLLTEKMPLAQIHVLDNFSQTRKNILSNPNITYHELDITDALALERIFSQFKPNVTMHFAALASVPDSVRNPAEYYKTNIVGTLNLLESCRNHDCKRIIFSSSASVYGEPEAEVIDENHSKKPTNPYGFTKLVGENMLDAYYKAYGISSVSFRYFCAAGNEESLILGEHHTPETHAIPSLVLTALGKRDTFTIYGTDYPTHDGTGVRDYIHVSDLAEAHVLAISYLEKNQICSQFNLGINKGYSVQELISTLQDFHKKPITLKQQDRRPGDPSRLIADAKKANIELGWSPKYTNIKSIVESAYLAFKKHYG